MIRITGGRWRGRRLETLPGDATRPAADAYRETILTILGPDLRGVRVLDLFAGSGAFAFESLSRGAESAVLVERSRRALGVIRRNVAALAPAAGAVRVVGGDAYRPTALDGPFDIVFVAPPYPHFTEQPGSIASLLATLAESTPPLLADGAVVVVQSRTGDFTGRGVPGLDVVRERRFGRTTVHFLERPEPQQDVAC